MWRLARLLVSCIFLMQASHQQLTLDQINQLNFLEGAIPMEDGEKGGGDVFIQGWQWHYIHTSEAVVVEVDALIDYSYDQLYELDVIVKIGRSNETGVAENIKQNEMLERRDGTTFFAELGVSRSTISVGYNSEQPDSCILKKRAPSSVVWLGVYCKDSLSSDYCHYNFTSHVLPRHVQHGSVVSSPIGPNEWHFYEFDLGDYDVATITLTRSPGNYTWEFPLGSGLQSHGHGLKGGLWISKRGGSSCPNNQSFVRGAAIDNMTETVDLEFFCSDAEDASVYLIGVQSTAVLPVIGDRERHNYNMPFIGDPNAIENSVLLSQQMVPDRPLYTLNVSHIHFEDGALEPDSPTMRKGCLGQGQFRFYETLVTTATASTVHVEVDGESNVSSILLRRNKRPTDSLFDARALHPISLLSASSCDVKEITMWNVGVHLAAEEAPGYFFIRVFLEDATLRVGSSVYGGSPAHQYDPLVSVEEEEEPEMIVENSNITTTTTTTTTTVYEPKYGYICCGAYKHYLVMGLTADASLRVTVRMKRGNLRALYIKREACSRMEEDLILPCDASPELNCCAGECLLRWMTTYDVEMGDLSYKGETEMTFPFEMHSAGDYYITIQGSDGVDSEAEYDIEVSSYTPPKPVKLYKCVVQDRFCPQDEYLTVPVPPESEEYNNYLSSMISSSPPKANPSAVWMSWMAFSMAIMSSTIL